MSTPSRKAMTKTLETMSTVKMAQRLHDVMYRAEDWIYLKEQRLVVLQCVLPSALTDQILACMGMELVREFQVCAEVEWLDVDSFRLRDKDDIACGDIREICFSEGLLRISGATPFTVEIICKLPWMRVWEGNTTARSITYLRRASS
jgi:hypothetical protein